MPAMAGSSFLTFLLVSSLFAGAAFTVAPTGRVTVASPILSEGCPRTAMTLAGVMMWIARRMRVMAVNMGEPRRGGGAIVPVRSRSSKSHGDGVAIYPVTSHGCHPIGRHRLRDRLVIHGDSYLAKRMSKPDEAAIRPMLLPQRLIIVRRWEDKYDT
ncbi:hypothetical protein MKK67_28040 [Methylobacterium sp. J-072]|uniref:hypothetical protein n=1 Tax=Methylobacterium sp. J-072 TaxID=2836651 RepID=UPI001FB8A8C7|nr:hypothetical protein [Methylobacterium sp. J-072]MCJ2096323.1 hypothetical protein [Methylobacterium sp. J-072]